jgi:CheY-like chemotaxis protein
MSPLTPLASRRRPCEPGQHVMVVEDEDSIREVTAAWLADEGFAVTTACNGADALRQLRHAWPDVIVLDLMMPVMDGWAFAEACHRLSAPVEIPIVVVSASHGLVQTAHQLREFGVRAYLAKPFDFDLLTKIITTLVERQGLPIAAAS